MLLIKLMKHKKKQSQQIETFTSPQLILIRVDGNAKIGMGHIARCLTLASGLRERGWREIYFLSRDYAPGRKKLENSGFPLILIPESLPTSIESAEVRKTVENHHISLVVVDILENSTTYLDSSIPENVKVVSLFDLSEPPPIRRGLIFNHNYYWFQSQQETVKWKSWFGGPDYVLIEPLYQKLRNQKEYQSSAGAIHESPYLSEEKPLKIFLNQGGGDPFGLTLKILKAFPSNFKMEVDVVLGAAFNFQSELKNLLLELKYPVRIYQDLGRAELAELMMKSDWAVTAAGILMYELLCLGIPSMVVCHHEEHNRVASLLHERNTVYNLGIGESLSEEKIRGEFGTIFGNIELQKMFRTLGKILVDGKGLERTLERIKDYVKT